jgi:hypothetical protein
MVPVSAAAEAHRADHYRDPAPKVAFGEPSPVRVSMISDNFDARMAG